ncbi:SRPBCC family protein [Pontibacter lucknowensis]|uniref:Uncharacterized conserved protein YndB, AHSA1/START domain n=1 Tax=Pontibacter lucknowensis TaxID=1077936 RepID=A0A1N6WIU9_9BACT|nr:SRPBCC family protein [Pontibacter lucknowensis]SIQ90087.1 Uncharacterized conserved protein YndB, AHSA1/START domain [Pontibacter lucknowensis]
MENTAKTSPITIGASIQAPVEKVWQFWTEPQHITRWNNASEDWHTPRAENDLQVGGKFSSRMEAKDGSMGFDFNGTYTDVQEHKRIAYTLEDGRKVEIRFESEGEETRVTESFEADPSHSAEMQQTGWQAILDNFKKYVEESSKPVTLHYDISIAAPADKVYRTMLDPEQYKAWTAVFHPTSHYKGSWEKGAKILFLGIDEDGKVGGMVSRIKENIPNQFISIEHLGLVQNGNEITSGPEVAGWAGALENYTFTEAEGETVLAVDVDTNQEYEAYFAETWPKALQKIKEMCETES